MTRGFVSSGLFMVVTNLYDSFHTSTIKYYKGIVYTMPMYTSLFFILILGNMAFPITMNFLGEFISTLSMAQLTYMGMMCPLMGMLLTGVYSLLLFNKMSFGEPSNFTLFSSDLTSQEFQAPTMLVALTIILGMNPVLLNMNMMTPFIQ